MSCFEPPRKAIFVHLRVTNCTDLNESECLSRASQVRATLAKLTCRNVQFVAHKVHFFDALLLVVSLDLLIGLHAYGIVDQIAWELVGHPRWLLVEGHHRCCGFLLDCSRVHHDHGLSVANEPTKLDQNQKVNETGGGHEASVLYLVCPYTLHAVTLEQQGRPCLCVMSGCRILWPS